MFRRFANRVNDAVSNAASSLSNNNGNNNSSSDARVTELAAMGFRESDAMHALRVANGDMNRATEWLLSNGLPVGTVGNPIEILGEETTTTPTTSAAAAQEDSDLQRAIQASLKVDTNNQTSKQKRLRSAASKNAGRAAASRSATNQTTLPKQTLADTHPKVQMPKRLSQHDQIDVLMRCANRVAPYSLAVDTLLRSLKTIQADPSNRKYHTVDTNTAMFQRSLNAPGVLDFLKAVNFHPGYNNPKTLTLSHFDPAAFYLGITSLEQLQQNSTEYKKDKTLRLFQKDLTASLNNTSEEELSSRKEFLSKLPSEPTNGGSKITVEYGILLNTSTSTDDERLPAPSLTKITRGFDHDDTLGDVLYWLGGQSSTILQKFENREWLLVDRNRQGAEEDYNFYRLDLDELKDRTLQYVGCWPSGRLAIVPKLKI